MVKLYKYDEKKRKWVFVDLGVKSKIKEYIAQGYRVVHKS
jgi:hypothetical protein